MIHQYINNGYHIVIDSNSGSIHVVDEIMYDMIAMFEQKDYEEILVSMMEKYGNRSDVNLEELQIAYSDLSDLKEQGILFSVDSFEAWAPELKRKQSVLKAICLHVAHDCNMRCAYCFAGEGEYSGNKSLLDYETGIQAIDYLIDQSKDRVHLEVDFFGGEPMMNFDVVKRLVAYARSQEAPRKKQFRFTFTTNGLVFPEEAMQFLNEEMSNIILSLDGRKEVHDKMRHTKAEGGTYDKILPGFQRMVQLRGDKEYWIRGTYTKFNKDFSNDVLDMVEQGFDKISLEPVVGAQNSDYGIDESDLPELFEQYDILAKEMLKLERSRKGFSFYHYRIDLEGGPCISKRISGCGVGAEYLAVTPTGDLYPCHQFVGDEEYHLGDVWTGIRHPERMEAFQTCNIYHKEECKDCFAKWYCSGGCAANAYHLHGDVLRNDAMQCVLHKKRIEAAIMMQVAQKNGPFLVE